MSEITISKAQESDITKMVELSDQKRREYEKAQPQFWRRHEQANENQAAWFKEILKRDDHILLIAEEDHHVMGFIIGSIIAAPSVYDPGGQTLMIDDFCVEENTTWRTVGTKLIDAIHSIAKQKGAVQILVVCGHHDLSKRQFLKDKQLELVSEWYVGAIK